MSKGRYHVKKGRISTKGKRAVCEVGGKIRLAATGTIAGSIRATTPDSVLDTVIVRNSQGQEIARKRQRYTDKGIGDRVRQANGGKSGIVERDTNLPPVHTQYLAPKSGIVIRLHLDSKGSNAFSRHKLRALCDKRGIRYTSCYGPTCFENDETGNVEIKLRDVDLSKELRAAGWVQCKSDSQRYVMKYSLAVARFAADFCWQHAGDWFTLSGRNLPKYLDWLYRGTSWSYPVEQFQIAPPGNGTTEHILTTHRYRKPKARSKSDGISGHEVARSRENNNGVRYIPRLYRVGKQPKPAMAGMVRSGEYTHRLGGPLRFSPRDE